ncbi:hypothetical protein OAQ99_00870 [Candidatus Kapabacteria bacterium]|nr:hypothetical protein [Candidatus Kapabacteria bacterium]
MKHKLDYFDLSEHNSIQKLVLWVMIICFAIALFVVLLPQAENFFEVYLKGVVYNSGESIPYRLDSKNLLQPTDYYTNWAIDIYIDTPQESRNWINPILSLFFIAFLPSLIAAVFFSVVLPRNLALIRQKIEREITSELDKITLKVFGVHTVEQRNKVEQMILNADLRDIHDYVKDWNIDPDDIISIRKALQWLNSSGKFAFKKAFSAISFFLRFYVTKKYANVILGTVYFGAALLIIVIGLRGLKFIPSSEPSLVFFSLGLEFTLLVVYAVTLMFGKESEEDRYSNNHNTTQHNILSKDFGTDKEAENLLKVFILKDKN